VPYPARFATPVLLNPMPFVHSAHGFGSAIARAASPLTARAFFVPRNTGRGN